MGKLLSVNMVVRVCDGVILFHYAKLSISRAISTLFLVEMLYVRSRIRLARDAAFVDQPQRGGVGRKRHV